MLKPKSVMIDVAGTALTAEDKELLQHPAVGGVILFARNYVNPEQLINLTSSIHNLRTKHPLTIAIDQEGGRVQRLQEGFTRLPPMRELGDLYDQNAQDALQKAHHLGWTMGTEMRTVGIDISFAPVLDLDFGKSKVIGNRAFHREPQIVSHLASAFVAGMHEAGLIAVGKHFPGHGYVEPDSHVAIPVDQRSLEAIMQEDILPFRELIKEGIDGIMPAHIIYSAVDDKPAGFSSFWLIQILRQQLNFQGIVFSDDLTMEGASPMGSFSERANKAMDAGCDMVLVCNNRQAAIEVINA